MNPVLLIDTYAQIYRSFFAIRELKTADGRPINALFGMAKFLLKIHAEYAGYDGAFAADFGKPAHRLALEPEYKANRPPTPDALKAQLPDIFRMIEAFGWQIHKHETWEADDLLSALTIAFPERQFLILSKDKDLAQLINERVSMLIPSHDSGGFELRDAAKTEEKFGIPPTQILDYLCLLGDTADNIPGIPGIGEKTAVKLLRQFGSIDGILEHVSEIKGKAMQENLRAGKERLAVNRKLVSLLQDLPPEFPRDNRLFVRKKPDFTLLSEIAQSYHMQSIEKEFRKLAEAEGITEIGNAVEEDESDLFSFMQQTAKEPVEEAVKAEEKPVILFQPELF